MYGDWFVWTVNNGSKYFLDSLGTWNPDRGLYSSEFGEVTSLEQLPSFEKFWKNYCLHEAPAVILTESNSDVDLEERVSNCKDTTSDYTHNPHNNLCMIMLIWINFPKQILENGTFPLPVFKCSNRGTYSFWYLFWTKLTFGFDLFSTAIGLFYQPRFYSVKWGHKF